MSGARLRIDDVAKTYPDGQRALARIDLDVAAGETIVLLGPSGCGKTTLLRVAAGLLAPDSGGRVWYDEADVTAVPIERREVGIVFQSYALFPYMSVAGNVGYGLRVRGVPRAERARRVAEVLALCRIGELADRPVERLSGGQRQRVALARAIAPAPRVLFLDEPLAALDARLRETLRDELDATLRAVGTTAVHVTHDRAEAMALGDRIVVMERGTIAQIATPRVLYEAPASRAVATFVGTLNRLRGTAADGVLRTRAGNVPWSGPDGEIEAFVRPHAVRLTALAGADLVGTVISVRFLGDRTRVLVGGLDEEAWTIDTDEPVDLAPGMVVGLAPRAGALRSLP